LRVHLSVNPTDDYNLVFDMYTNTTNIDSNTNTGKNSRMSLKTLV